MGPALHQQKELEDSDWCMVIGVSHSEPFGLTMIIVVLTALAGWLTYCGFKRCKSVKLFRQYVMYIPTEGEYIETLAASIGIKPEKLYRDLKYMIRKNYFQNACIDEVERKFVIVSANNIASTNISDAELEYVKCNCCGGTSRVRKGMSEKCDYCGSPVKVE